MTALLNMPSVSTRMYHHILVPEWISYIHTKYIYVCSTTYALVVSRSYEKSAAPSVVEPIANNNGSEGTEGPTPNQSTNVNV